MDNKTPCTYWDFLKEAFHLKVPLPFLGAMPLNKLLLTGFCILGFAHPGFWLIGTAYEAGYLLYLPGNPRFQRLIRGTKLAEKERVSEQQKVDVLQKLSQESRERFLRLYEKCQDILRISSVGGDISTLSELNASSIDQLLSVFLRILASREKITKILSQTKQQDLEKEIAQLTEKATKEPEGSLAKHSFEQSLEIDKKRLDNLKRAEESLKAAHAELIRIEKQVSLLSEETAVGSDASQLSSRLDGISKSLQGTSKWMSEHADLFSSFEELGRVARRKEMN